MNCPKCNSEDLIKDGFVGKRQRYSCKSCGYRHTIILKSSGKSLQVKRMALMMYLEGLGFRSIARVLGVSNVIILRWIRLYGMQPTPLRSDKPMEIVKLNKETSYIQLKKISTDRRFLLIEIEA